MDLVNIIDELGWPVSFETLEKVEEEKEGWYFFDGELFIDKKGGLWFRGNRVKPKVWANLAALFEMYNEDYVGALLNLVHYDGIRPTWGYGIYADGVYFKGFSAFMGYYEDIKYNPVRKEFKKKDRLKYFATCNSSSGVNELYWIERTSCGLFARDVYDTINFVKTPFAEWEYTGDGGETKPFVEKQGKYTTCIVDAGDYSVTIKYGPWVHVLSVDYVIRPADYVRPGWFFIGSGWLKRFGKLYVFRALHEDREIVKNRWGDNVVELDGAADVLGSRALVRIFRWRGLL